MRRVHRKSIVCVFAALIVGAKNILLDIRSAAAHYGFFDRDTAHFTRGTRAMPRYGRQGVFGREEKRLFSSQFVIILMTVNFSKESASTPSNDHAKILSALARLQINSLLFIVM